MVAQTEKQWGAETGVGSILNAPERSAGSASEGRDQPERALPGSEAARAHRGEFGGSFLPQETARTGSGEGNSIKEALPMEITES